MTISPAPRRVSPFNSWHGFKNCLTAQQSLLAQRSAVELRPGSVLHRLQPVHAASIEPRFLNEDELTLSLAESPDSDNHEINLCQIAKASIEVIQPLGWPHLMRHSVLCQIVRKLVYRKLADPNLTLENLALSSRVPHRSRSRLPEGVTANPVQLNHLDCEWLLPANVTHKKIGLYFFGGAYIKGGPETHRPITTSLAIKASIKILAGNYRKLPHYAYPSQLEDASAAFNYLLAQGYQSKDIVIMGDSSGAHLALCLAFSLIKQNIRVGGMVLISPLTDMSMTSPTLYSNRDKDAAFPVIRMPELVGPFIRHYDKADPRVSPLKESLEIFSGLPPTCVHYVKEEVLAGDSEVFIAKALQAGVKVQATCWSGLFHVFQLVQHPLLPEARRSIEDIASFLTHLSD